MWTGGSGGPPGSPRAVLSCLWNERHVCKLPALPAGRVPRPCPGGSAGLGPVLETPGSETRRLPTPGATWPVAFFCPGWKAGGVPKATALGTPQLCPNSQTEDFRG